MDIKMFDIIMRLSLVLLIIGLAIWFVKQISDSVQYNIDHPTMYNATSVSGQNYICRSCGGSFGGLTCSMCGNDEASIQASSFFEITK
jgi:hypothetical protein